MIIRLLISTVLVLSLSACSCLVTNSEQAELNKSSDSIHAFRATGDLGVIIERATGSVKIVDTGDKAPFAEVQGLGDLSHASIVFSRDQRFAYIFGRDGGLTKVDLLKQSITHRVIQSGNSIGGAISQDGRLVAVSNYSPGGVKVFDSETLELLVDLPATEFTDPLSGETKNSKVVGLADAPGQKFVFSLFDTGEIWVADFSKLKQKESQSYSPEIQKFQNIGKQPYDALISPDGRYYIAGLFGEDGMAKLDLWHPEKGVQKILPDYGKGEQKLPVYKMPHLEGWTVAGNLAFVPAVGQHQVLVIDMATWEQVGKIDVYGQPIFVMARPDGRQIWVNFAYPNNDTLQVIDSESRTITKTLTPGKGVLHMEFTPRGEHVWASVRDMNLVNVYDTETLELTSQFEASSPSGIFFTSRAHKIGL
jgi:protein NirF